MAEKNDWQGFVNIDLTRADKAKIKQEIPDSAEAIDWIQTLVLDGYRVSLSWYLDGECYVVSVTAKDGINVGLTFTMRHADLMVAIAAARFAHEVKTVRDWRNVGEVQSKFDW